jgi:hypothetical protein
MAKAPLSDTDQVTAHIRALDPAIADTVEMIRQIILGTDPYIAEQIKWNSPSFYYTGEMKPFDPKEYKRDIAVLNLHRGRIMIVLPTGAKLLKATRILEGKYTDGRRLITFSGAEDVKDKEEDLREVIREWLSMVEK